MLVQVLLMFVTFGFYGLYWFHTTAKEMAAAQGKSNEPVTLWTVLFFIPPLLLYSYYKYAELYEQFSNKAIDRWVVFVLFIVFNPAVWFIVQSKLNEVAHAPGTPPVTV
jgi:hypothetical protein